MMRKLAWTLCLTLPLMACGTSSIEAPSEPVTIKEVVTPPLYDYSPAFQKRLKEEMTGSPACDRQTLTTACSATNRALLDYSTVRDKIREAKK